MVKKKNIFFITLANILFCIILLFAFAFLNFRLNINMERLFSLTILLLTGVFCGFITSKKSQNKKLMYTCISSSIFLLIFLAISFLIKKSFLISNEHLICALNIYFGAVIGSILSLHQKNTRKGRKKLWNTLKL